MNQDLKPLMAGRAAAWIKALWLYGPPQINYIHRAFLLVLSSGFSIIPRIEERIRYSQKIRSTKIDPPPIFVIGSWRSGTTFLHTLLIQDNRFGYMANYQVGAPEWYICGEMWMKKLTDWALPPQRPMDSMPLRAETPQEDEFAMLNISELSQYFSFFFPRRMKELFDRFAVLKTISDADLSRWKNIYELIVKKAVFANEGRQLILKNPVNTGRIPQLLELFPDALFVFIFRNPYDVYPSTIRTMKRLASGVQMQDVTDRFLEDYVMYAYPRLIRKYLDDKIHIPQDRLIEIQYEHLSEDPLAVLKNIYERFNLADFDSVQPQVFRYLESVGSYKKTFSIRLRIRSEISIENGNLYSGNSVTKCSHCEQSLCIRPGFFGFNRPFYTVNYRSLSRAPFGYLNQRHFYE